MTSITLAPLEFVSTGTYRCEVSTEAPHFKTVVRHSNMTVLGKPNSFSNKQGDETFTLKPNNPVIFFISRLRTYNPVSLLREYILTLKPVLSVQVFRKRILTSTG